MKSLRKSVSVVLQDTYLFSISIRENLRYGNLNATDEEIMRALEIAQAKDFVKEFVAYIKETYEKSNSTLPQKFEDLLA